MKLERERRISGLQRVPFVKRCALEFADGQACTSFIVNINVLGAYLATEPGTPPGHPILGERISCRFQPPDRHDEVVFAGVVTWVNVRQQHPVHSLPPGFGVKFDTLDPVHRGHIERIIADYVSRTPTTPE